MIELGQTVPLQAVQSELETVDALSREIQVLTSLLQVNLSPELFKLVWSLRDAVEKLGLCEALLRERQIIDGLARHLQPRFRRAECASGPDRRDERIPELAG